MLTRTANFKMDNLDDNITSAIHAAIVYTIFSPDGSTSLSIKSFDRPDYALTGFDDTVRSEWFDCVSRLSSAASILPGDHYRHLIVKRDSGGVIEASRMSRWHHPNLGVIVDGDASERFAVQSAVWAFDNL